MARKKKANGKVIQQVPLTRPAASVRACAEALAVLESGWWTCGPKVEQLEREFAAYVGAKHAVALSSCSASLFLAVQAMKGSQVAQVAVTPMTFVSTVNAIILNGMVPHFVDIDRDTGNMDTAEFNRALTENPAIVGVVVVHLAGRPCNMERVMRIARAHGVWVVEDCAHAVEAKWAGRHAGTFGAAGCFSFNPTKNISAPEMGMLVTNRAGLADAVRLRRLHGMSATVEERVRRPGDYGILALGYKVNPTDLEAVFALDGLRRVDENWKRRRDLWEAYCGLLGLKKPLDDMPEGSRHALHLFQFPVADKAVFIREAAAQGVYCGSHYPPAHRFAYMKDYFQREWELPRAEWWGEHVVSIPFCATLTREDVAHVVKVISKLLKRDRKLWPKS